MSVDFAPIKITACDENKVRKASSNRARYVVPFSLSAKPARDWEDIFDDVWRSHRKQFSSPKAQAYIRKGEMVIECGLGDLKEVFRNVRVFIDNSNEKYVEQLRQKAEKNEKKKRKREEETLAERTAIREALKELDFS